MDECQSEVVCNYRIYPEFRPWVGRNPDDKTTNPSIPDCVIPLVHAGILPPSKFVGLRSMKEYELSPYDDNMFSVLAQMDEASLITGDKPYHEAEEDIIPEGVVMLQVFEVSDNSASLAPLSLIHDFEKNITGEAASKTSFVITICLPPMWNKRKADPATSWTENDVNFDKPLEKQIGSLSIKYAVFSNAARAKFEIKLLPHDKKFRTSDLYGEVSLGFSLSTSLFTEDGDLDSPEFNILLFHKTRGGQHGSNNVAACYGGSLELQRPFISVPRFPTGVVFQAKIFDGANDDFLLEADRLLLTPRSAYMTHWRKCSGKSGDMLLKVTWNA